jgi:hypothetical protein
MAMPMPQAHMMLDSTSGAASEAKAREAMDSRATVFTAVIRTLRME